MTRRIGLYGGSFDPIHIGHLIVARNVAERMGMEQVIFLPTAHPPHKEAAGLLDGSHRSEMVKLAIEGEPLFAFSDYDLTRERPTYTVDTIAHFKEVLGGGIELYWIIGADSLAELNTWDRVAMLVDSCRIVTASRPGCGSVDVDKLRPVLSEDQIERLRRDVIATSAIDISSSDIRRRLGKGQSVRYLVPDAVWNYITEHHLYGHDTDPH